MKEIVLENGNALAFIGDAIYSLMVKEYFIRLGYHKPNVLQKKTVNFVSAKAQAQALRQLMSENYFTETELEIIYRGRNAKSESIAKNADVITYRMSTGFEALLGYLYLYGHQDRLQQIWDKVRTL